MTSQGRTHIEDGWKAWWNELTEEGKQERLEKLWEGQRNMTPEQKEAKMRRQSEKRRKANDEALRKRWEETNKLRPEMVKYYEENPALRPTSGKYSKGWTPPPFAPPKRPEYIPKPERQKMTPAERIQYTFYSTSTTTNL